MKKSFFIPILLLSLFCGCESDDPEIIPDKPGIENPEDSENPEEPEEPIPDDSAGEGKPAEYWIHSLNIKTENNALIESKEVYIPCLVSIESNEEEWCLENIEAGIRGRGNSTWEWYPKKPYRIKFDKKQEVLGLGKAKSWVLLAEYRDPTDLMNTYVFELGRALGMPFTNHNRYVWVTLNGEELGLYHLTEQVQQGGNRVDIDDDGGRLLSLDRDDGPELSNEPDNFWSATYRMPVCVKHPEDRTPEQLEAIRQEFNSLEQTMRSGSFEEAAEIMDLTVFADFLLIQELVYNVELDAPRSMYIHKDKDGKWTMGPLWDFDAGFDFDWGTMYTGHKYFSNYRELVMGTDPYLRTDADYNPPRFFTDIFRYEEFRTIYKKEWDKIKNIHENVWETSLLYVSDEYWQREEDMWPIGLKYNTQISNMGRWLTNRINYLDAFITKL